MLIVGGRQSAYEWAALIGEHGAARIDVVHRHDEPRFERVSWRFVDPHVERTARASRAGWRTLPAAERDAITPPLLGGRAADARALAHPAARQRRTSTAAPAREVVDADAAVGRRRARRAVRRRRDRGRPGGVRVAATAPTSTRVPYLAGVATSSTADGFPVLDEALRTSLAGLYVTGFPATRDFGPFFGFVKAAPAAATLIVRDLLKRH